MAHHQIRKLKNRNENLSRDLNNTLEDLDDANRQIRNLENQIRWLQIQLNISQERIDEKEMLLREKDETLVDYLAQINEMDNDLNSCQGTSKNTACPLCFKDMSSNTSEWVEIEPCGHRKCYECFITAAEELGNDKERQKKLPREFTAYIDGYEVTYRYICGICDGPAKNWTSNLSDKVFFKFNFVS